MRGGCEMMIPQTPYCHQCIDRQIAMAERILDVITDPHNHTEQRRRLRELLLERQRMQDSNDRMGLGEPLATVYPEAKSWTPGDGVGQEG